MVPILLQVHQEVPWSSPEGGGDLVYGSEHKQRIVLPHAATRKELLRFFTRPREKDGGVTQEELASLQNLSTGASTHVDPAFRDYLVSSGQRRCMMWRVLCGTCGAWPV